MKRSHAAAIIHLLTVMSLTAANNTIWFDRPANRWQEECLPLGNGRLGCMIYGGVEKEHIQFNEDTLWIGDEEDTGAYQAFGDLFIELGETEELPGTGVSNPSRHSTMPTESVEKSTDGKARTKWCMEHKGKAVTWQLTFSEPPGAPLQSYSFTSANDVPTRDPRKWKLEGSNDGRTWTLLDERNIDKPFPKRHMKKTFTFENDTVFAAYRFTFEPLDGTHFQVAEIALGGKTASVPATAEGKTTYRRELDIGQSLHTISYEQDGINYRREYFASHPANILVFRLSADMKGAYSGAVTLRDAHGGDVTAEGNKLMFSGKLSGRIDWQQDYAFYLDYEAQVVVLNEGGSIKAADGKIVFKDCDELVILLDGGTDYLNRRAKGWKQEHPHKRITKRLAKATRRGFDKLLAEHVEDYKKLFDRVSLDLGESPAAVRKLTPGRRLDRYRGVKAREQKGTKYEQAALGIKGGAVDPDLEELLFQFARYLMISSSRSGCMPANLQGLWNHSNTPPWRCDYHSDVNIQMNYWFVDQANLSDCFTPLSEWLWSVVPVKRDATEAKYGVRGWMHRSENGIFGGQSYKWIPGDAAWIMQNIWDHYAFTLDKDYLESRAYPLLKELCEHWEDFLIEWPDGALVSPKSVSPEHGPEAEGNSYEQQLVHDLFTNYIEAANALGKDQEFRQKVESMRSRLLGPRIGKWGQLQEWAEDRDNPNDKHRHLSHLIAVHPGRQISPVTTPKLAEAARVSMNARGDGATGWSKAWKINIWARLHDGNRAYKLLNEQVKGNYYANLFGFHPPFQIDGNFGYAAGLCEMLVQSHMGVVHLLPSLPDAWPSGKVGGLKARGGFVVDIEWKDGRLTKARIESLQGTPLKIKYGETTKEMKTKKGSTYEFDGTLEG